MSRPNIVFIIMDDLAWGDLACHGNPYTRTPHLDALHGQSARLTRYCTGPLCSPARASVITGRYHPRTRVFDTYCGRSSLDPGEPTIARTLAAAGYSTGMFGKWHLGDTCPNRPCDLGFQETLYHRAGGLGQPGDLPENHERPEAGYFDPVMLRNGGPEAMQGYCTDVIFEAALAFIEAHRGEPFFAYVGTNAPHSPLHVADEWAAPYRQLGCYEQHARLYGMVANIDWNVGRLMARLDALGLAGNTVLVYTSDHGPCGSSRQPDAPPDRQMRWNAGLRGIKGSLYQGGIQVPHFWRWPGRIPAGRDLDRIASPIDVLPTLLAAAEVPLPAAPIDGVNLLPLLTGQTSPAIWPERTLFMQWHRGSAPERYRNYAAITQRYKLYRPQSAHAADELYDVEADPLEKTNLAAGEPGLVADLRARYDAWFDEVAATRGPGTFDPVPIEIGTPRENPTLFTRNDWIPHGPRDAWYEDDVRCHWEVRVAAAGRYRVMVRDKPGIPSGLLEVRLGDLSLSCRAEAGAEVTEIGVAALPAGLTRLEAWRTLDRPRPGALYGRYQPALYVQIEKLPD